MLPRVLTFIAAISAEAAHVAGFYQYDISCHCLLAFICFMGIAAYYEWGIVAAAHNVTENCNLVWC